MDEENKSPFTLLDSPLKEKDYLEVDFSDIEVRLGQSSRAESSMKLGPSLIDLIAYDLEAPIPITRPPISSQGPKGLGYAALSSINATMDLFPSPFPSEFKTSPGSPSSTLPSLFSILSSRPEILSRNFLSCDVLALASRGKWQKYAVSDDFPSGLGHSGYPFTTSCSAISPLSILLLEKALAYLYGSYEALFAVRKGKKLLSNVLNAPILRIALLREKADLWIKRLGNSLYRGFLVFFPVKLGCLDTESLALLDLLDQKITVKASNSLVSRQISEFLNSKPSDSDVLTVSIDELANITEKAYICQFHENYSFSYLEYAGKAGLFLLHSPDKSLHFYLSLLFEEKRHFQAFLAKSQESRLELLEGRSGHHKTVIFEVFLDSGDYCLLIEFPEDSTGKMKTCISLYSSSQDIRLEEAHAGFAQAKIRLWKDIAVFGASETKEVYEYCGNEKIHCFSDLVFGCFYVYVLNQSKKRVKDKLKVQGVKGLKGFRKWSERGLDGVLDVGPDSDLLILYVKGVGEKGEGISISHDPMLMKEEGISISHDPMLMKEEGIPISHDPRVMKGEGISLSHDPMVMDPGSPDFSPDSVRGFNSVSHNPFPINRDSPEKPMLFTRTQVISLVKKNGKVSHRKWQNSNIDVFCYSLIHPEGVIFLYCNYTYFPYEENIVFELENLEIENRHEENVVRFQLEPYSEHLVFLGSIDVEKGFQFKSRSYYKYYPEKL